MSDNNIINNNYSYKTLKCEASADFTEKKSVFTGFAKPIYSEEQAIDFIEEVKKKFANINHCAFAYIIRENNITRFSDDGEPSGTAGMPILNVLQKNDLTNVAAAVTRYFGGILLGAGGLVRAYGHAAKIAVESAGIAEYQMFDEFCMICNYGDYEKILKFIEKQKNIDKIIIDNSEFLENAEIYLAVKRENFQKVCDLLTNLVNAKCDIIKLGERFDFI